MASRTVRWRRRAKAHYRDRRAFRRIDPRRRPIEEEIRRRFRRRSLLRRQLKLAAGARRLLRARGSRHREEFKRGQAWFGHRVLDCWRRSERMRPGRGVYVAMKARRDDAGSLRARIDYRLVCCAMPAIQRTSPGSAGASSSRQFNSRNSARRRIGYPADQYLLRIASARCHVLHEPRLQRRRRLCRQVAEPVHRYRRIHSA